MRPRDAAYKLLLAFTDMVRDLLGGFASPGRGSRRPRLAMLVRGRDVGEPGGGDHDPRNGRDLVLKKVVRHADAEIKPLSI